MMKVRGYVFFDELEWTVLGWQSDASNRSDGLTDEEMRKFDRVMIEESGNEPDYDADSDVWVEWMIGIAHECGWEVGKNVRRMRNDLE